MIEIILLVSSVLFIFAQTVQVDGEDVVIGMLSNRCKTSHSYINRQQLWSDS